MEELKTNENLNVAPEVKPVKLKALKIITAVLYSAMTAFLLATLIDVVLNPGSSFGLEVAVYLVVFVLMIGSIGYGITTVVSAVGIIISVVKRNEGCDKKTLAYFIVFAILPAVTECLFVLICKILTANPAQ